MKTGLSAVIAGCLFALLGASAAPAQPQKPAAKAAPSTEKAKPVRRLPGAGDGPPPGVRVPPPVGQSAKPAEKKNSGEKAAGKKKVGKKAAKPAKAAKTPKKAKKKSAAKKDEKVKSGRAALSAVAGVDANQLAVDELKGAEDKSPVELLESYKQTLRDGDLETAAIFLRLTAGDAPGREDVIEINDLLGLTLDTQDTEVLIDLAKARRADSVSSKIEKERAEDSGEKTEGDEGSDHASRIQAAHAAVADAPRRSALTSLANYKHAVAAGNKEAAALALAAATAGRTVGANFAARVDVLLGLVTAGAAGELAGGFSE